MRGSFPQWLQKSRATRRALTRPWSAGKQFGRRVGDSLRVGSSLKAMPADRPRVMRQLRTHHRGVGVGRVAAPGLQLAPRARPRGVEPEPRMARRPPRPPASSALPIGRLAETRRPRWRSARGQATPPPARASASRRRAATSPVCRPTGPARQPVDAAQPLADFVAAQDHGARRGGPTAAPARGPAWTCPSPRTRRSRQTRRRGRSSGLASARYPRGPPAGRAGVASPASAARVALVLARMAARHDRNSGNSGRPSNRPSAQIAHSRRRWRAAAAAGARGPSAGRPGRTPRRRRRCRR